MKKSLKEMLGALNLEKRPAGADNVPAQEPDEREASSAAERLGRALLNSFGALGGVSEDELVEAILSEWPSRRDRAPETETADEAEQGADPFGEPVRRPVPMRTGSIGSKPVDYSEMSVKQFNDLKKLLKKAHADGKRIKL